MIGTVKAVHPKHRGDLSTLAIMLALTEAGFSVSVPFGENCRYDLVVEEGGTLLRVQCKTGRLRDGSVRFATASTYGHLPSPRDQRRDYVGQVDAFAVFCPDTGGVYVIPIDDLETRAVAYLRVEAPRNGQRRLIRPAARYEVANVRLTRRRHDDPEGPSCARPADL
jgi:hypothetical protein